MPSDLIRHLRETRRRIVEINEKVSPRKIRLPRYTETNAELEETITLLTNMQWDSTDGKLQFKFRSADLLTDGRLANVTDESDWTDIGNPSECP